MRSKVLGFYKALFAEADPPRLQQKFLDLLMELQNVERGSIWVKTDKGYLCHHAAGAESDQVVGVTISPSKPSIVGWVMENGEMTIAEAGRDRRHFKALEASLNLKSNLILCFPLVLTDGSIYGAVQIIDTSAEGDRLNLNKEYLELLQTMVDLGGLALSNTLSYLRERDEKQLLKQTLDEIRGRETMVGRNQAFLETVQRAANYAATDFPVLITGESGTGKELMAQELHSRSSRAGAPFMVQNCSAIPDNLLESELFGYKKGAFTGADKDKKGLFEAADGGMVFLDEIGDMPMNLQARILRVLQNQEVKPLGATKVRMVDVRVISATNRDLPQMIRDGSFREDLFFRLNVLPLQLPPLRERPEDIPLLLNYFMQRESQKMNAPAKQFTESAQQRLAEHPWPGNVRELQNTVKYVLATVSSPLVNVDGLPLPQGQTQPAAPPSPNAGSAEQTPQPEPGSSFKDLSWADVDQAYVEFLLEKNKWNVSQAAREAQVNRSTFDSRMKKMGLSKKP